MCFAVPRDVANPESKIDIVAGHCASDHTVECSQVFGVDQIPGNYAHANLRRGIAVEDTIGFLGPIVVVCHQISDEAARFAESLGFSQPQVGLLGVALSACLRSLMSKALMHTIGRFFPAHRAKGCTGPENQRYLPSLPSARCSYSNCAGRFSASTRHSPSLFTSSGW